MIPLWGGGLGYEWVVYGLDGELMERMIQRWVVCVCVHDQKKDYAHKFWGLLLATINSEKRIYIYISFRSYEFMMTEDYFTIFFRLIIV